MIDLEKLKALEENARAYKELIVDRKQFFELIAEVERLRKALNEAASDAYESEVVETHMERFTIPRDEWIAEQLAEWEARR